MTSFGWGVGKEGFTTVLARDMLCCGQPAQYSLKQESVCGGKKSVHVNMSRYRGFRHDSRDGPTDYHYGTIRRKTISTMTMLLGA